MSDPSSEDTTRSRALHWGVMTWVGNGAGCLVGMVPIALPVSAVLVVATFLTGIWAMVLGVRERRQAPHQDAEQMAMAGFWLGAAHVVFVLLAGGLLLWGLDQGHLKDLGVLP